MKITKLKLVNFGGIYTGLKLNTLEIDLTNSINRVILLIGKNGSGKTTILSNLHPFAYPGNMDVRNGSDIILQNKDGYKELHLEDNEDTYIIKHYYTRSRDSRNVKSFISKNGVELNPNGNVTSFKEMVELELGLEQDFLKLLRLGSNVTSFIGMRATDRKKSVSTLLADIDVFSGFYKKVNDDSRLLKNIIKTSSEKLRRLGIGDYQATTQSLIRMSNVLTDLNDKKNNVTLEMGKVKGSMESLYDQPLKYLKQEILDLEERLNELTREKKTLERTLDKMDLDISDDYLKRKSSLEKEVNDLKTKEAIITSELTLYINELDNLYSQKETKEENLKYIDSENHISKLEEMKQFLKDEIYELNQSLKGFNYDTIISKEEALTLINSLKDIKELILDIFSYDQKGEIKTFFKYAKNNIKSTMKKKIDIIDKNMLVINMQLNKEINEYGKNELLVMYKVCDHTSCPYIKYYEETSSEVVTKRDELKTKLVKLDSERTFYSNIVNIDDIMTSIKFIMKHNKDIIERSPFNIDHVIITKCLEDKDVNHILKSIMDISTYISQLEAYNDIKEKEIKLEDIDKEIEMLQRNAKSLDLLKDDITHILSRINELTDIIDLKRQEKEKLVMVRNEKMSEMTDIETFIITKDLIEDKIIEIEKTDKLLSTNNNIILYLSELDSKYLNLEKEYGDINNEIVQIQNQIDDVRLRLREFDTLSKELEVLDNKFEEIEILKESLSSNKGIPLLFVQLYLRSTRKFVNDLLSIVYKGSLEIETFIINDKEFSIPYTKEGITTDDVIYASQGEQSFISLCMSLALIKQSIKKYNILLLDEVDSTLDEESRPLFLTILESYLDEIGCEQVFMITHNNAFDNYNIDMIITTPDKNIDNFKKVNVIYKR